MTKHHCAFAILILPLLLLGCGKKTPQPTPSASNQSDTKPGETRVVRLHFEGFTKSKSGAT